LNHEAKQAQQAKPGQPSQACREEFRNERQRLLQGLQQIRQKPVA
jgi:hypothetical protein